MQTLHVNGYDMAYLEVGRSTDQSPPLVCIHGTLGDFRTWSAVSGPLSKQHRVISVSLRHFFPEHWDGDRRRLPDGAACRRYDRVYREARSRAGRPDGAFARRPHCVPHRRAAAGFVAPADPGRTRRRTRIRRSIRRLRPVRHNVRRGSWRVPTRSQSGDIDGALQIFFDMIEGEGKWARLPAAPKQQLRDNAYTLVGQVDENRLPYTKAGAQVDQDADAVHRRRRHQGRATRGAARAGGTGSRRPDRDDPGRRRTGCSNRRRRHFRDRAGISGVSEFPARRGAKSPLTPLTFSSPA